MYKVLPWNMILKTNFKCQQGLGALMSQENTKVNNWSWGELGCIGLALFRGFEVFLDSTRLIMVAVSTEKCFCGLRIWADFIL